MIDRHTLPEGSVAYFIERDAYGKHLYVVNYGIVEEYFHSEVSLAMVSPRDRRMIDGVPIQEFKSPSDWRKLPKGWTWDMKPYQVTEAPLPDCVADWSIKDPNNILEALRAGVLVKNIDNRTFDKEIEAESDKQKGYRIWVKHSPWDPTLPGWRSFLYSEVYATYEEAQTAADAEEAEMLRQASLSDYDWSLEQIDHELDRWAKLIGTQEAKELIRARLLELGNIEEMVVRFYGGNFQWKYIKNTRWNTIVVK